MGSAMRKMGVYLGLLEDTERYDEEYYDEYDERTQRERRRRSRPARPPSPTSPSVVVPPRAGPAARRPAAASSPSCPGSPRCTRAPTTRPASIGENFRDGVPVIMNLSEMDDTDAKRLVDFAAGLVFAVRGTIERVTNKVFLLSPPNVSVAAEDKQRIAEGGFFNQS